MEKSHLKIIALIGLPGAGKSTVADILESKGFQKIRLGDITREEMTRRGMQHSEVNEKVVRDDLRKRFGMAAYAKMTVPKVRHAQNERVVLDDLISFEEVEHFKKEFEGSILFVHVSADKDVREQRLINRPVRPLSKEEVQSRDNHQLNALNMQKTIDACDRTLDNNRDKVALEERVEELIEK